MAEIRLMAAPMVAAARRKARGWLRPYTSVQAAWVRAMGIEPRSTWTETREGVVPCKLRKRELRETMAQRYGVRGL